MKLQQNMRMCSKKTEQQKRERGEIGEESRNSKEREGSKAGPYTPPNKNVQFIFKVYTMLRSAAAKFVIGPRVRHW